MTVTEPPSRRHFLKSSARLVGVLATGSAIAAAAPGIAWALEAKHLNQVEADIVLSLSRLLFPHRNLPDAVYALVVKDIDVIAAQPAGKLLVGRGVAALDRAVAMPWNRLDDERKLMVVRNMIADPFIETVRSTSIVALYDNDMAYAHFGYQGDAFSKGGYIRRGFNDLDWLPNPSVQASPLISA